MLICMCKLSFADSWIVSEIYEAQNVPSKSKAIDQYDDLMIARGNNTTVHALLVPCTIEDGRYKITISEMDSNVFHILGTNYYIEMYGDNFCGPTSILRKTAEVILIKEGYIFKIEYDR